ncbi:MAG: MFS transporter [Ilumatobacteraceae bacterium]|nr:MFS transporter [Ilumatobacteraceae bacterium]
MLSLLRRNREIRLVFAAQVISYLGDWFTFVALAGLVEDLTGSKFLVSLVLVSFTLPAFFTSPIAGAMADRYDRRRIIIIVSLGQGAAALTMLLVTDSRVWLAFVAQSVISGLGAFVRPASEAAIPNLVDNEEDLRTANSVFGSTWGVMLALGAALGGIFSQTFGRNAAFLFDAVSFAIAAGLIALVHRAMQSHETGTGSGKRIQPIADMKEAVTLARQDPIILALLSSKVTFAVGAGIVSQLPILASNAFQAGDAGRGLLIGARGVGSGLGPLIAMRLVGNDMSKLLRVCGLAGLVFSFCYFGAAISPVMPLACLCIGLAHLGGGAQWTLSTYGLQVESPDHLRGRVMAGDFALVTLMLGLTSILAGLTSDAIGVRPTIAIFAAAAASASITYLLLTKKLVQQIRARSLSK